MKILLINSNQVVQKLIEITTRKIDCELLSLTNLSDLKLLKGINTYHLVIADDESIHDKEREFFTLCEGMKSILLYSQYGGDISLFSYAVKKPFLPNEFLKILVNFRQTFEENHAVIQNKKTEVDEKNILAEIDHHGEDEDFEQLLKELRIGNHLDDEKQEDFLEKDQENFEFEQLFKEETLEDSSQKVLEDMQPQDFHQENVLNLDDVKEVKDLLRQTQHSSGTPQNVDLKILQALFDQPIEEVREALDGMEIQINIAFKKE